MDQLKALAKYVLSFLRKEWTVTDYPLRFRRQGSGMPDVPEWSVQVVNWWVMTGLGGSREEALRDLGHHLEARHRERGSLPRPGTKVPLEFASAARIEHHALTAKVFLNDVLGFSEEDPVFVSDESSLWDFVEGDTLVHLHSKIQTVFGVDVSDITDGNIAKILERIG